MPSDCFRRVLQRHQRRQGRHIPPKQKGGGSQQIRAKEVELIRKIAIPLLRESYSRKGRKQSLPLYKISIQSLWMYIPSFCISIQKLWMEIQKLTIKTLPRRTRNLQIESVRYFRIPFASTSVTRHHRFRDIFHHPSSMPRESEKITFRSLSFHRLNSALTSLIIS